LFYNFCYSKNLMQFGRVYLKAKGTIPVLNQFGESITSLGMFISIGRDGKWP